MPATALTRPTIRRATHRDIAQMRAVKLQMTAATYGPLGTPAQLFEWQDRFCSADYFAQRLTAGDRFYVIEDPHGRIIAMAALKVRDGKAYMGDLYVEQPGRGLGRALAERREQDASGLGLAEAVCDVWADNPRAQRFVSARGYRQASEYVEQTYARRVLRLTAAL